ncbi:pollen receptor-like kinase 1 [Rosa chinensis]|nr:pollen receptor-like kinase 1 [Rosa chinensis]
MARNKAAAAAHNQLLLFLLAIVSSCVISSSSAASEAETLITFKNSLSDTSALDNWNASTKPCTGSQSHWTGVQCNNGSVSGLQLEKMSLTGLIDIDTLTQLPALKAISFMNNGFGGPLPDVKRLSLQGLYLSQNQVSGDIPDDAFSGMGDTLKKLYLAKNGFTGEIPSSLVDLPKLIELDLGDNQFTGEIPYFHPGDWTVMNLANNRLEGQIPASLSNLDAAELEGR